uniref:ORF5 protein n=1 Tax=Middle East respiratory syndrome-related coronavirus TaxID=1335626 RepID=A0A2I6PIX5_MERS|nr:ORF5 protein [Middle East respiratory syndrome-related coronavirus]
MAYSLSIFRPPNLVPAFAEELHGGEVDIQPQVLFTCVPTVGYSAALAVNACLIPFLLCLNQDTCRNSVIKTLTLYGLMLYNFVLAAILVSSTFVPLGSCLLTFVIVLSILWFVDRIRFCLILKSFLPLIDMRSHFVRVSTCSSQGIVAVNSTKPCFIRNFDQRCRCSRCFYVHSAIYIECTFISRFEKVILVSVTDFSLGGKSSTVFVPATRDTVPLHIIAPSVLTV